MQDGASALDAFYASPRGRAAAGVVRASLRRLWPSLSGLSLLGLGYPLPYLRLWQRDAARAVALAQPELRPRPWPPGRASLLAAGDGSCLPFADRSFERVLMVHALESSEQSRRTMREAWRVLAEGGRLIVVVPNRRGLWAHTDRTPFGQGRPYSSIQLETLCRQQMFQPRRREEILFVPPFPWRPLLRTAPAWDAAGRTLCPGLAGLLVQEAEKSVLAPVPGCEALAPRQTVVVEETA